MATSPEYFDELSPASVETLALQGGPMSPEEVLRFHEGEENGKLDRALRVRRYEEIGKAPAEQAAPELPLSQVAELVKQHLLGRLTSAKS